MSTNLFQSGIIGDYRKFLMVPKYDVEVVKSVLVPEPVDGIAQDIVVSYAVTATLHYHATHYGAEAFKTPVRLHSESQAYSPIYVKLDAAPDYEAMRKKNDGELSKKIRQTALRQAEIKENTSLFNAAPETEKLKAMQAIQESERRMALYVGFFNELLESTSKLTKGKSGLTLDEVDEWLSGIVGAEAAGSILTAMFGMNQKFMTTLIYGSSDMADVATDGADDDAVPVNGMVLTPRGSAVDDDDDNDIDQAA